MTTREWRCLSPHDQHRIEEMRESGISTGYLYDFCIAIAEGFPQRVIHPTSPTNAQEDSRMNPPCDPGPIPRNAGYAVEQEDSGEPPLPPHMKIDPDTGHCSKTIHHDWKPSDYRWLADHMEWRSKQAAKQREDGGVTDEMLVAATKATAGTTVSRAITNGDLMIILKAAIAAKRKE